MVSRVWQGIILLSGAKDGELAGLVKGNLTMAREIARFYQTHFADRYYLELHRNYRGDDETYLHAAVEFAAEQDLPLVATNGEVFWQEDFEFHEIRVCHDGYPLDDARRLRLYSEQQYLRSEMCELFADILKLQTGGDRQTLE